MTRKFKVLVSSLAVVLIIAVISSFMPASSSYAYPGGYANGKTAILENTFNSGALDSTNLITDNDETTFFVLPAGKVMTIDLGGTYNYDKVKLKADTNALRLNVYNASKAELGGGDMLYSGAPDGTSKPFLAVNVRYISLVNKSGVNTKIYELDVTNTADPVPTATVSPTSTPDPTVEPTLEPTATPTATPEPSPSATPEAPSGDRAILNVTLTTGDDKEFDIPMSEVAAFLNWYNSATGSASYGIDKHDNNKGPFSKRTEYVIHDKILTFEVSEYTAQ
ncbi:hypothetical protein [Paenibacillus sp. IHB B 3415]|uniref:hypothetical protein n=1 Tax=Paenibacillus sp. IHB B 3415 TaxID=867080 RepID=UPI00069C0A8A|nr:hypothetical protein [Paenibacillus sp. IHB B 3415]